MNLFKVIQSDSFLPIVKAINGNESRVSRMSEGGEEGRALSSIANLQLQMQDMLREIDRVSRATDVPYFISYGTALGAKRSGGFIPWDYDVDIQVPHSHYSRLMDQLRAGLPARYAIVGVADRGYDQLFTRLVRPGIDHHVLHVDIFPIVGAFSGPRIQEIHRKTLKFLTLIHWFGRNRQHLHDLGARRRMRVASAAASILPVPLISGLFSWLCSLVSFESAAFVLNPCGGYGAKEVFQASWFEDGADTQFGDLLVLAPKDCHSYLEHLYGDYSELPSQSVIDAEMAGFWRDRAPKLAAQRLSLGQELR